MRRPIRQFVLAAGVVVRLGQDDLAFEQARARGLADRARPFSSSWATAIERTLAHLTLPTSEEWSTASHAALRLTPNYGKRRAWLAARQRKCEQACHGANCFEEAGMGRMWVFRSLFIASMLCAGCSTPYSTPVFDSRPKGNTDFPGIAQLVAATPDKSIDLLIVHGMCAKDEGWARRSISDLSHTLGGPEEPDISRHEMPDSKIMLYRSGLSTPSGKVHASVVLWSPVFAPLKSQLCYDQTDKTDACQAIDPKPPAYELKRAKLNAMLKDKLLDDCLADVLIYESKSRDAISKQLQRAILTATTADGARDTMQSLLSAASTESRPIVLISESLGSKMTFDAIHKLQHSEAREAAAAGERVFDRLVQIFMAANQLPILALADQHVSPEIEARKASDYQADPLGALIERRKARSKSARPVQETRVVAFTDPNDLLSYTLSRATANVGFEVVDAIVSNDSTWFGLVENPGTAHTKYLKKDGVVNKLIACGTKGCP